MQLEFLYTVTVCCSAQRLTIWLLSLIKLQMTFVLYQRLVGKWRTFHINIHIRINSNSEKSTHFSSTWKLQNATTLVWSSKYDFIIICTTNVVLFFPPSVVFICSLLNTLQSLTIDAHRARALDRMRLELWNVKKLESNKKAVSFCRFKWFSASSTYHFAQKSRTKTKFMKK